MICFGQFVEDEELIVLPCGHEYHEHCIRTWLERKSTCPLCRKDARDGGASNLQTDDDEDLPI